LQGHADEITGSEFRPVRFTLADRMDEIDDWKFFALPMMIEEKVSSG